MQIQVFIFPSIQDCDRVAVFSRGELVEFAPPDELLKKDDSAFASLARDAGVLAKKKK